MTKAAITLEKFTSPIGTILSMLCPAEFKNLVFRGCGKDTFPRDQSNPWYQWANDWYKLKVATGVTPTPTLTPTPGGSPTPTPTPCPTCPTYYIAPPPLGNDSNPGTSPTAPLKTFNKAIPLLKPGYTLILEDGTYIQNQLLDCRILYVARTPRSAYTRTHANGACTPGGNFTASGSTSPSCCNLASIFIDSLLCWLTYYERAPNKLSTYGYFTPGAGYVFTYLASRAGERLGLSYKLAQTFGRGYSWIRTGWFDLESVERRHLIKQIIFFKLFFPLGRDFISWDFNSPAVKTKLKAIVYKFAAWQSNPDSYIQDIRECREQLEPLWYGLSLALNLNEEFSEFITA